MANTLATNKKEVSTVEVNHVIARDARTPKCKTSNPKRIVHAKNSGRCQTQLLHQEQRSASPQDADCNTVETLAGAEDAGDLSVRTPEVVSSSSSSSNVPESPRNDTTEGGCKTSCPSHCCAPLYDQVRTLEQDVRDLSEELLGKKGLSRDVMTLAYDINRLHETTYLLMERSRTFQHCSFGAENRLGVMIDDLEIKLVTEHSRKANDRDAKLRTDVAGGFAELRQEMIETVAVVSKNLVDMNNTTDLKREQNDEKTNSKIDALEENIDELEYKFNKSQEPHDDPRIAWVWGGIRDLEDRINDKMHKEDLRRDVAFDRLADEIITLVVSMEATQSDFRSCNCGNNVGSAIRTNDEDRAATGKLLIDKVPTPPKRKRADSNDGDWRDDDYDGDEVIRVFTRRNPTAGRAERVSPSPPVRKVQSRLSARPKPLCSRLWGFMVGSSG